MQSSLNDLLDSAIRRVSGCFFSMVSTHTHTHTHTCMLVWVCVRVDTTEMHIVDFSRASAIMMMIAVNL